MPPVLTPLRRGDIVRIRGQRWRVVRHTSYDGTALLEVTGCDRGNGQDDARFLIPFDTVERLPAALPPRVVNAARWRHSARLAVAGACESPTSLRAAAQATFTVLPFQLEPALALLQGAACRILIADAVGLGKTIQAGLIVAELVERNRDAHAIVVCPAGLREQWQAELRDRFHLDAAIVDSTRLARHAGVGAGANPWAVHPVVIASVDYLKRPEVIRSLEMLVWDVAIFDEAHALAGRSERAGAATVLAERARNAVLLTATPHSGDEDGFQRLCALGDLRRTFPLLLFRRNRRDHVPGLSRRSTWLRVQPTTAEAAMHSALAAYAGLVWKRNRSPGNPARLAMSLLARRASSSASSLARSLERRLALLAADPSPVRNQLSLPFSGLVTDDEPVQELGAPGLADLGDELTMIGRVLELARRASANESKLGALRRLLRRARQPSIVFTEYRDTLSRLASEFEALQPVLLHGGMTLRERRAAADAFTSRQASLMLATDAASEGLNLQQRCRLVINLELPWTPTRLEQRIGRVDRIGQQRRVHAIHLVVAGAGEHTVVAGLLARMQRIDAALDMSGADMLGDESVAAAVIVGDELPPIAERSAWWAGHVLPDPLLRLQAIREGEAIVRARELQRLSRDRQPERRPVLTVVRRRIRPQRLWLFRLDYLTDGGGPLWTALIGLAASDTERRGPAVSAAMDALHVDAGLMDALAHEHVIAAARVASDLTPGLRLARSRELAIIEIISARRARLAATLIQPGLFGRGLSGFRDAQAAAAADLIDRCRRHLARLESAGTPVPGAREFVCAVLAH
jgi:superfamily II DNA or RNA helicase